MASTSPTNSTQQGPLNLRQVTWYRSHSSTAGEVLPLEEVVARMTCPSSYSAGPPPLPASPTIKKELLPAAIFSGAQLAGRKNHASWDHAGLAILDLDHLDSVTQGWLIHGMREKTLEWLRGLPFVIMAFISPRGAGAKVLVSTDLPVPTASHHEAFARTAARHLLETKKQYVLERFGTLKGKSWGEKSEKVWAGDPSTSNLARLCYLPADETLTINPEATPIPWDGNPYWNIEERDETPAPPRTSSPPKGTIDDINDRASEADYSQWIDWQEREGVLGQCTLGPHTGNNNAKIDRNKGRLLYYAFCDQHKGAYNLVQAVAAKRGVSQAEALKLLGGRGVEKKSKPTKTKLAQTDFITLRGATPHPLVEFLSNLYDEQGRENDDAELFDRYSKSSGLPDYILAEAGVHEAQVERGNELIRVLRFPVFDRRARLAGWRDLLPSEYREDNTAWLANPTSTSTLASTSTSSRGLRCYGAETLDKDTRHKQVVLATSIPDCLAIRAALESHAGWEVPVVAALSPDYLAELALHLIEIRLTERVIVVAHSTPQMLGAVAALQWKRDEEGLGGEDIPIILSETRPARLVKYSRIALYDSLTNALPQAVEEGRSLM